MKVLVAARLSQLVRTEDAQGRKLTRAEAIKETIQTGLDTQEQEVIKWAEFHGHEIVDVAADFQRGVTHLWERPNLRPWVTETALLAQYDAIAALKVDRLTRANDEGVDALKAWARANGKQILITSADVKFPSEGVEGVKWDLYIRFAHQEYLEIKERYGRMQNAKHDAGAVVGRPPWGYEVIMDDGIKTLVPTAEGRIWVPRIFGWIAEGKSTREVSKLLKDAGVKSGAPNGLWHEATIQKLIRRPTYAGLRERKDRASLPVEPLVSTALQDRAMIKLSSRAKVGAASTTQPKALLAKLKCGHPECPGEGTWPMYRNQNAWYRCAGRGAQRQGCGNPMVPLETLDNLVLNLSAYWDHRPYRSQRYVSGNDAGVRLDQLRAEMADAMRHASDKAKRAEIYADYDARIEAVEAEGTMLPHWEDVETGLTEGQHLRSLDLDGQREYLARKDIRAWKDADGVVHASIDGAQATIGGRTAFSDPRVVEGE